VSLISVIFAQMLPNVVVTTLQLVVGIGVVVAANAFVSHWLATRGTEWEAVGTEFVVMAGINLVIGLIYVVLLPTFDGEIRWRDLLFFTFLLTLLVTLYDRYRPIYDLRVAYEERQLRENERGTTD
jgi:MFS family permease